MKKKIVYISVIFFILVLGFLIYKFSSWGLNAEFFSSDFEDEKLDLQKNLNLDNFNNVSFCDDLSDEHNKKGVLSREKGTESNISVTNSGAIVSAFEDKENNSRIRVKIFRDGRWWDLADSENEKGLISKGKGGNPFIVTRGEDVFVAFMESDFNKRARVRKWDNSLSQWTDLADFQHKEGFMTDFRGHEPVLVFDKNNKYLYLAYNKAFKKETKSDCPDNILMKVQIKRWDGNSWSVLKNKESEFISGSNATEVVMASSKVDESVFVAFEDRDFDNKLRVMKFYQGVWYNLSSDLFSDALIGDFSAYSPAMQTDYDGNLYLAYHGKEPSVLFFFKWDGAEWFPFGKDGVVSDFETTEPSIAVTKNNDVYIAFSEFREGVLMKKRKSGKDEYYLGKSDAWRTRLLKLKNNNLINSENDGFMSFGNGKGDPSIVAFGDDVFVSMTDRESKYSVRVEKCKIN